jgi:hypothetical protein
VAIVGEAYVVVRAITTQLRKDIESAVNDAGINFDKIGAEHGRRYSQSFGNSFAEGIHGHLGTVLQDAMDPGDIGIREGAILGDGFTASVKDSVSTGLADIGSEVVPELENVGRDAVQAVEKEVNGSGGMGNVGNKAGKSFADGLAKGVIGVVQLAGKLLFLGSAISVAVGGLSALVSGLLAVVSAAGPATAALGAFAAQGLTLAAQAFLTFKLAFSGVGKALSAQNSQMAKTASGIGGKSGIGGSAVSAAQKLLTLMQQQDALSNAQRAVKSANEGVLQSEKDLAAAREQAKKDIRDINESLQQSVIDEGTANIALQKAREKLALVSELPPDNRLRQEAQLAYDQAQLNYKQAVEKNQDLTKEANKANKAGVEGSDTVVKAKKNVVSAQQQQVDAARNLTEVLLQQKIAAEQANKAMGGGAAGANALKTAMSGLSPAAQAFVKYLASIKPELDKLKAAAGEQLFPKLTTAIQMLVKNDFPLFEGILRDTGGALGDIAIDIAKVISSAQGMGDIKTIADGNVSILKELGKALAPLISAFLTLTATATPFIVGTAKNMAIAAGKFNDFIQASRKSGDLTKFWAQAWIVGGQLWQIVKNIASGLFSFGKAVSPAGNQLIDWLVNVTGRWADFKKSTEEQNGLKTSFSTIVTNVEKILVLFAHLGAALGDLGANPAIGKTADSLDKSVLPPLTKIVNQLIDLAPQFSEILGKLGPVLDQVFGSGIIDKFVGALDTVLTILDRIAGSDAFKAIRGPLADITASVAAAGIGIKVATKVAAPIITTAKGISNFAKGVRDVGAAADEATGLMGTFGGVAKKASDKLIPMANSVVPKLKTGFGTLLDRVKSGGDAGSMSLEPLAKGFDKVKGKITDAIGAVKNFGLQQKIAAAATAIWEGVQAAFNAVMALNPIVLIVIGIGLLIAAIILAYNKIGWFRDFVNNALKDVVAAFNWIIDAAKAVWQWISSNWPLLLAIITGPFGLAVKFIIDHWDQIKAGATKVKDWIVTTFNTITSFITGLPARFASVASGIWTWITDKLTTAWNVLVGLVTGYVSFWAHLPGRIISAASGIFSWLGDHLRTAWGTITGYFTNTVIPFFTGLPSRIATAASGMWNGIRTAFVGAINAIISVWNNLSFPSFSVGGWKVGPVTLPTITTPSFDLPNISPIRLALGGVVSPSPGGTIAQIAEAGRAERVTPLDKDGFTAAERKLIAMMKAGQSGPTVPITVHPSAGMDEVELAAQVSRQVAWTMRRSNA